MGSPSRRHAVVDGRGAGTIAGAGACSHRRQRAHPSVVASGRGGTDRRHVHGDASACSQYGAGMNNVAMAHRQLLA